MALFDPVKRSPFETTVLIHLDGAYNLARWLVDDQATAEDAVQEACIRAQRFFHSPSSQASIICCVRMHLMVSLLSHRL